MEKLYMIQELCVVCITTHIINLTLWVRAVLAFNDSKSKIPTGAEWAKQMKKKKSELFRQFGGVEVEMETNGT